MNNLMDLHCHTIACGHAYSTVGENIQEAKRKGLKIYGMSEHGYGAIKNLKKLFFINQRVVPDYVDGIRVLKGIEANILDYYGRLAEQDILHLMDYTIASLHRLCTIPGSKPENTAAIIGAMENEYVNIIGHLDDVLYPIDHSEVAKCAADNNVAIEVNNASLQPMSFRKGCRENYFSLLEQCALHEVKIIMSSDAHFYTAVGDIEIADDLVKEIGYPTELIVNYNVDLLNSILGIKVI